MPTIEIIGPYRFFFYASDRNEPIHVHVKKEKATAKYWVYPVRLQRSKHFRDYELREIERLIETNKEKFVEIWNEYFND